MKLYKTIIFSLITSILILAIPHNTNAAMYVSANSAVLMEQKSGRVLYEKDANTKRRIASITKIMTAILAIESGNLDEKVTISENAVKAEGSSVYLKVGEKIPLKDLVYGLMLRSGNDAAVAIAESVGGSLDGFVYLMNQKAEEIGMSNTHFANPHGLDDHENHYSTAYDMALLTRYAMNNDTYKKIAGTKKYRSEDPSGEWDRVWNNKNRLLTELYDYSTGGKTGYTKRAKRTLVSTAEKDGLELIAVTLNDPDDWDDHINMFETSFKKYKLAQVIENGKLKDINNAFYKNKLYIKQGYEYPITSDEEDLFQIEYKLSNVNKAWKKDENKVPNIVGEVQIYFDHKIIDTIPIYYQHQKKQSKSFFGYFKQMFISLTGVGSDG
ncbi:D-alanyl-D-alanine carboxypeptidase family protein [Niallia sp. 01092]|uniref:D-alanyl-D-alanine carboxypeptidase family protein n=1 Tax=unclassified Niallia TaxID=2837522 RepID=UPI003FD3DF01